MEGWAQGLGCHFLVKGKANTTHINTQLKKNRGRWGSSFLYYKGLVNWTSLCIYFKKLCVDFALLNIFRKCMTLTFVEVCFASESNWPQVKIIFSKVDSVYCFSMIFICNPTSKAAGIEEKIVWTRPAHSFCWSPSINNKTQVHVSWEMSQIFVL